MTTSPTTEPTPSSLEQLLGEANAKLLRLDGVVAHLTSQRDGLANQTANLSGDLHYMKQCSQFYEKQLADSNALLIEAKAEIERLTGVVRHYEDAAKPKAVPKETKAA